MQVNEWMYEKLFECIGYMHNWKNVCLYNEGMIHINIWTQYIWVAATVFMNARLLLNHNDVECYSLRMYNFSWVDVHVCMRLI